MLLGLRTSERSAYLKGSAHHFKRLRGGIHRGRYTSSKTFNLTARSAVDKIFCMTGLVLFLHNSCGAFCSVIKKIVLKGLRSFTRQVTGMAMAFISEKGSRDFKRGKLSTLKS